MLGTALAVAALFLLGNSAAFAAPSPEENQLIDRAAVTVQQMRQDPAFDRARAQLRSAKGVLVVPALVKGGFIFGAEGGNGVLMQRNADGWSPPSFGLQAGLEQAEVVMLVMSDKALDAIKRSEFKLGAGGGITVVTLSAGAEVGVTAPNVTADIIVWQSGTGVYGGITLNGSVIKARDEWNTAFYGRRVDVSDILGARVRNPEADRLRQQLATL